MIYLHHSFSKEQQSEKQLSILNNKRIVTQVADKYSGCVPEGFFSPTNEFVLNCTDNALHFISSEDGSTKKSIAQFDVIQDVLIDKNMLFLVSGNYLYGYIPKARTSPLWKISVSNIEIGEIDENYPRAALCQTPCSLKMEEIL